MKKIAISIALAVVLVLPISMIISPRACALDIIEPVHVVTFGMQGNDLTDIGSLKLETLKAAQSNG
ncbi:MAG: hypothetical protein F6K41_25290 [Symploca sp. SIO3E6]|nr:hypothetical protein [Caldora sp. SIO3E6]